MSVRAPLDVRPDEPGWWLASDGKWYPPERPPGWSPPPSSPLRQPHFFDSADKPSAAILGAVAVASLVASWLAMGWDLSEVDAQDRKIDHTIATWRFGVGVALLWGATVVTTWLRRRGWKWIAATATVGVELWYTWRGYAGRTYGANMTGAGSMFLLLPIVVATFSPTWITSRVVQRRARRPGTA